MTPDIGKPLCKCSSVGEFLKVMFDLVESHRLQVQVGEVLHRDPSWGNCLVSPNSYCPERHDYGGIFIEDLLGTDS